MPKGLSNQQIASRMGFRDKRTVSRINGQIYSAWNLNETTTDEKVARTRAAIIVNTGRLISWDKSGRPHVLDERGEWVEESPPLQESMTGNLALDWAVLAASLFNTILLAWLGITVLLNSDRRRWGIWLAGGGLLLGAVFFVSHTAVLGQGLLRLDLDSKFYLVVCGYAFGHYAAVPLVRGHALVCGLLGRCAFFFAPPSTAVAVSNRSLASAGHRRKHFPYLIHEI